MNNNPHNQTLHSTIYRFCVSQKKSKLYALGATWRWANADRIMIFGQTITLKSKQMLHTCSLHKHLQTRPSVAQIHCCFMQLFKFCIKHCRSQRGVDASFVPKTMGALCGLGDGVIVWTNSLPRCTFLMHRLCSSAGTKERVRKTSSIVMKARIKPEQHALILDISMQAHICPAHEMCVSLNV